MSLKLITEHKNYLLLIDFSAQTEIPDYGWCFEIHEDYPSDNFRFKDEKDPVYAWWFRQLNMAYLKEEPKEFTFWKKLDGTCMAVIAHLPLNNAPILEGVPLLPELPKQEEDGLKTVGKEAFEALKLLNPRGGMKEFVRMAAEFGYKKAASKRWTDEDMERCFEVGQCIGLSYLPHSYNEKLHEYLESLSPTLTPIGFEPEYEEKWENQYTGVGDGRSYQPVLKLKVVNNILQGTYKFKE